MGGRYGSESVAGIRRNTHFAKLKMKPIFLKGIRPMLRLGTNRPQPLQTFGDYLIS